MSKDDRNILFVTRDLSNRIEKSSYYLLKELRKKQMSSQVIWMVTFTTF